MMSLLLLTLFLWLLGVKKVRAKVTFDQPMEAGRDRKRLSEEVRARILGMVLEK